MKLGVFALASYNSTMNYEIEKLLEFYEEEFESSGSFTAFVATISPLEFSVTSIKGDVLVGGCGGGFPERILLCSPGSGFSLVEGRVASLTCADPDFFTDPALLLDNQVTHPYPGDILGFNSDEVYYYPNSLQTILPSIDESTFNTVLFFRIQRLQEQLVQGLYKQLHRVIKPGGYLLGSGSFKSLQDCQLIFQNEFILEQVKQLPNPDHSGYVYEEHEGFVLRKKA